MYFKKTLPDWLLGEIADGERRRLGRDTEQLGFHPIFDPEEGGDYNRRLLPLRNILRGRSRRLSQVYQRRAPDHSHSLWLDKRDNSDLVCRTTQTRNWTTFLTPARKKLTR